MPRLLATQSHVVHGYVGNKAATFPLQCIGWDVDCVNTVQFSNHTGYGMDKVFGTLTKKEDLEALLKGVSELKDYNALLSGYLPNRESVNCMAEYYSQMKKENPELLWLLDPVMGDDGELYVNKDVVPEYKALVASSLVDVITPNQFELEILYGNKICNVSTLKRALAQLHETVPVVVVTSCSPTLFKDPTHIYCVASLRNYGAVVCRVPVIDSYFTGVGDLFSALLIDRLFHMFLTNSSSFAEEVNHVLNVIHSVLEVTLELSPKNVKAAMGSPQEMKEMELRIIESRDCYEKEEMEHNFIYKRL
ncbi:LAFE_0F12112g1_1 [Lachancea fermentati]|uniref:pyridoxal kinase n=1 Tax=Lachancea fermentati TaxID=4955 RepID=A0A1G4MG09_LACFM|nr:LAFE_0F12112g1_1 [Lachancea fermentati]